MAIAGAVVAGAEAADRWLSPLLRKRMASGSQQTVKDSKSCESLHIRLHSTDGEVMERKWGTWKGFKVLTW